jgi:lysophospholipase L1-like esterase
MQLASLLLMVVLSLIAGCDAPVRVGVREARTAGLNVGYAPFVLLGNAAAAPATVPATLPAGAASAGRDANPLAETQAVSKVVPPRSTLNPPQSQQPVPKSTSSPSAMPLAKPAQFVRVPRTVFIGDSITAFWAGTMPEYFSGYAKIDNGFSGETTPVMVGNFERDAIAPAPMIVLITGGTNDLAGNSKSPAIPAEQTLKNIESMAETARKNCIRVIVGSIPPSDKMPWAPSVDVGPMIVSLNANLKAYTAQAGIVYADFWTPLHDPSGNSYAMKAAYTADGVHPNAAGYAIMAQVADQAFTKLLAEPASVQFGSAGCPANPPVSEKLSPK